MQSALSDDSNANIFEQFSDMMSSDETEQINRKEIKEEPIDVEFCAPVCSVKEDEQFLHNFEPSFAEPSEPSPELGLESLSSNEQNNKIDTKGPDCDQSNFEPPIKRSKTNPQNEDMVNIKEVYKYIAAQNKNQPCASSLVDSSEHGRPKRDFPDRLKSHFQQVHESAHFYIESKVKALNFPPNLALFMSKKYSNSILFEYASQTGSNISFKRQRSNKSSTYMDIDSSHFSWNDKARVKKTDNLPSAEIVNYSTPAVVKQATERESPQRKNKLSQILQIRIDALKRSGIFITSSQLYPLKSPHIIQLKNL
ncbi:hypothetical protein Ciccas_002528 [Cichlidogyrus casuarinus]|uniref:Exophilin 5 n=1 Tax=Cichlidogyrus casuarinus TaxID=1844966 RepID=A0ABD2QHD0_9PLAT